VFECASCTSARLLEKRPQRRIGVKIDLVVFLTLTSA
jgi:hypothetical protein